MAKDHTAKKGKDSGQWKGKGKGHAKDRRSEGGEGRTTDKSRRAVLRLAPKDAVPPLLVSFTGQTLPPSPDSVQFGVHGNKSDPVRKRQRVVWGSDGRMDYWGLNFGPGAASHDLCSYVVGVHDPSSGEVTLHQAGHAYALRATVTGKETVVPDHASDGVMGSGKERVAAYAENKAKLVENFGSKKKQRAVRAAAGNVVSLDTVLGRGGALARVLGRALQEEAQDNNSKDASSKQPGVPADAAEAAAVEGRRALLPPYRLDAETVEGVYALEDLAPAEELAAEERMVESMAEDVPGGVPEWLKDALLQDRQQAARGKATFPKYVATGLARLHNLGDQQQRQRLLQLMYLRHLIKFHLSGIQLKGRLQDIARHLGAPEPVIRNLLQAFAVSERGFGGGGGDASGPGQGRAVYRRTKSLKDRLLIRILCLALVLEGCKLDFAQLAEDLKLAVPQARQLIRELGCAVNGTVAQLKVPLKFPEMKKFKGSSRR